MAAKAELTVAAIVVNIQRATALIDEGITVVDDPDGA
jgi:hypothetical protein